MALTDGNFDLSPVLSPMRTAGLDPNDPQSLALFTKLQGGGVGLPNTEGPAPPAPSPVSEQPNRTPATVTPSGNPQGKTIAQKATERAYEQFGALPTAGDELAQEKALEEKRTSDAATLSQQLRDPQSGKLQEQYRPSVGQRILRGLQGFARGGTTGVLNANYGAPNNAGQQELRREQGAVASDDQSLSEMGRRFKEAREAATGSAAELRGIAAEDRANRPAADKEPATQEAFTIQTAKTLYPNDPQAQQKYIDEHGATGRAKAPTNYEQTVIAAQGEADPNGPLHRAAKEMRDTEVRKFKAGNSGRQPTETELWAQAFQTEYGRKPNAEEIASRRVAGAGTAGGAAGRTKNVPDRASSVDKFDAHWENTYFKPMERRYDTQRATVTKNADLTEDQKQAEYNRIEAERAVAKQDIQDRKDEEAEKYQVYNQQPAAAPAIPAAVTPSGVPSSKPQASGKKLDPSNPSDMALARSYLEKAGGDKDKARKLARADGHNF